MVDAVEIRQKFGMECGVVGRDQGQKEEQAVGAVEEDLPLADPLPVYLEGLSEVPECLVVAAFEEIRRSQQQQAVGLSVFPHGNRERVDLPPDNADPSRHQVGAQQQPSEALEARRIFLRPIMRDQRR